MLSKKTIDSLKELAKWQTVNEQRDEDSSLSSDDFFGGNLDDAFSRGEYDGKAELARKILEELNIPLWIRGHFEIYFFSTS